MSAATTTHPRLIDLIERRKLRKQVARAVSRLIAVLDDLDVDPEAEPNLGAPEAYNDPDVAAMLDRRSGAGRGRHAGA